MSFRFRRTNRMQNRGYAVFVNAGNEIQGIWWFLLSKSAGSFIAVIPISGRMGFTWEAFTSADCVRGDRCVDARPRTGHEAVFTTLDARTIIIARAFVRVSASTAVTSFKRSISAWFSQAKAESPPYVLETHPSESRQCHQASTGLASSTPQAPHPNLHSRSFPELTKIECAIG